MRSVVMIALGRATAGAEGDLWTRAVSRSNLSLEVQGETELLESINSKGDEPRAPRAVVKSAAPSTCS